MKRYVDIKKWGKSSNIKETLLFVLTGDTP